MEDPKIIVPGFRAGAVAAGIRKAGRLDLGLIAADRPCAAAGLFTRNRVAAPSVRLNRARIRSGRSQAIIANSGNANTCVPDGLAHTEGVTTAVASVLGIEPRLALMNSTGVIGEPLPVQRVLAALPDLARTLRPEGLGDFARAIMTTDTRMKFFSRVVGKGRSAFRMAVVAKGAGMIEPHMATMLCYVLTDAGGDPRLLRGLLSSAAFGSLNSLTVDGDTSTSDSLILLASGASGFDLSDSVKGPIVFQQALEDLLMETAEAIAADGEGATRMFRVLVTGAKDPREADRVARKIANSPLVKTAIHAADPNWGRIMAAAGASGAPIDPARVSVLFKSENAAVEVVKDGFLSPAYSEEKARRILSGTGFTILVDLGRGERARAILTCDFSADYVRINAEYRT